MNSTATTTTKKPTPGSVITRKKLTTLITASGQSVNLPAQLPGLMDTASAIRNAMKRVGSDELRETLVRFWEEGEAVGVPVDDIERDFVSWMAEAGNWSE